MIKTHSNVHVTFQKGQQREPGITIACSPYACATSYRSYVYRSSVRTIKTNNGPNGPHPTLTNSDQPPDTDPAAVTDSSLSTNGSRGTDSATPTASWERRAADSAHLHFRRFAAVHRVHIRPSALFARIKGYARASTHK